MYENSIIFPLTTDAIKNQDDSITDEQCHEIFEYIQKEYDVSNGISWIEVLKVINLHRKTWTASKK